DRSPGRLDLARRHPARFHRLEPVVALRDPVATMGRALHPAALEFAVLEPLGPEHQPTLAGAGAGAGAGGAGGRRGAAAGAVAGGPAAGGGPTGAWCD